MTDALSHAADDPSMSPPTGLRLLGVPAVLRADGSVHALDRRAAALLALVAMQPGTTRARAASLLWPDSEDPRRALRQLLLRLRRNIGVTLDEGPDALRIAASIQVDALLVSEHAGSAQLLGDLSFEDCEGFADWLARERERLRQRKATNITQLASEAEAAGDLEAAIQHTTQLLDANPDSEVHHRSLMRLHYLRGDIAQALAVYRGLRERLRRRFDIAPSAETEQLARTVQQAHATARTHAVRSETIPVTVLRPPRLIGRHAELEKLLAAWSSSQTALVQGEPGMGKSRLLDELLIGERHAVSVRGRPGDAGVPYATLSRLLRSVLTRAHALPENEQSGQDRRDALASSMSSPQRQALALLLPDLAPTASAEAADSTAQSPTGRVAHQVALAPAVEHVLLNAGLVGVVIDDLHFVDPASCEMFQSLMASEQLSRLRWAFAQRGAEVTDAARLLMDNLLEDQRLSLIELSPLDTAAMRELLESLALPDLDINALAEPLTRHTGGNPLYAIETLKQGLSDGSLSQGQLPRPGSVHTLLDRRLQRLPERALALARVAAIAGVDFSIDLAESVMGLRAIDLADAWRTLQDAQVLRDEGFAHDLVLDAVRRGIPQAIARHLHGQCAAFLSAHHGEAARVAAHWEQAEQFDRAIDALQVAARSAGAAGRYTERADFLKRAAEACARCGRDAEQFDLLIEHVETLTTSKLDDQAVQLAESLEARATTPAQQLAAIRTYLDALGNRGHHQAVETLAQRGIALAREHGNLDEEIHMGSILVSTLAVAQRIDDAGRAYDELRAAQAQLQNDTTAQHLSTASGVYFAVRGQTALAIEHLKEDLRLCERLGKLFNVPSTLNNLAVCYLRLGKINEATHYALLAKRAGESDPDSLGRKHQYVATLGRCQRDLAHFDLALDTLDLAHATLTRTGMRFWQVLSENWLAATWVRLGQSARASQMLTTADDDMPPFMRGLRRLMLAAVRHESGQRAAELIEEGRGLVATVPLYVMTTAALWLPSADPAEALELALRLAHEATGTETMGVALALQVRAVQASTALGKHERALELMRTALDWVDQGIYPEHLYLPEVWLAGAQAQMAAGQAEAARRTVSIAVQWIKQTALPHVPAAFTETFLNRNAVNRQIFELAGRRS